MPASEPPGSRRTRLPLIRFAFVRLNESERRKKEPLGTEGWVWLVRAKTTEIGEGEIRLRQRERTRGRVDGSKKDETDAQSRRPAQVRKVNDGKGIRASRGDRHRVGVGEPESVLGAIRIETGDAVEEGLQVKSGLHHEMMWRVERCSQEPWDAMTSICGRKLRAKHRSSPTTVRRLSEDSFGE